MTVRVELVGAGTPRHEVLAIPETLTVTVTRQDGYAPSPGEIYAALQIALESMDTKGKRKAAVKAAKHTERT
jgi:hypothetical protein